MYRLYRTHGGQIGGRFLALAPLPLRPFAPHIWHVYLLDGSLLVSCISFISSSFGMVYRSLLDLRRASTSSPIFCRSPARQLVMLVGWNNRPPSLSSVMSRMYMNCFTRSASLSRCSVTAVSSLRSVPQSSNSSLDLAAFLLCNSCKPSRCSVTAVSCSMDACHASHARLLGDRMLLLS